MPHVDKHAPGEFTWIELATTDQDGAKSFYSSLFGWAINDMPMGPGEAYTIFKLDGRDAAACYKMRPEELSHGVPPHWNLYIAVANADEAVAKAEKLGGKILAPAFDVMDAGRMAVIQDPTGATFCVWQANRSIGIGIESEPGTLCWADLNTPDPEKAKQFYSGLFGWEIAVGEHDPSGYLHIKNGDKFIGGIPPLMHPEREIPPHWLAYIQVADVDATADKADELGAAFFLEPMTMENVGRMAVLADPQGAVLALFKSAR